MLRQLEGAPSGKENRVGLAFAGPAGPVTTTRSAVNSALGTRQENLGTDIGAQ